MQSSNKGVSKRNRYLGVGIKSGAILALAGVSFAAGGAGGMLAGPKTTTPRGFTVHSADSAPAESQAMLRGAQESLGFVPNLFGTLSESPQALEAYMTLSGIFSRTSLSPTEQTVILLTASVENECQYCVPAHTMVGKNMLKVEDPVIEAVRNKTPLADSKLEALRTFTKAVLATKGDVGEDAIKSLLAAGYTRRQALEVVVGLSLKTLSNYTNRLVDEPLDAEMAAFKWEKPKGK